MADGDDENAIAGSLNRDKARRAARDPARPGERCRAPVGASLPVVTQSRCEGKKDCVDVCPYHVFEVRRIDDADFAKLTFFGRLKNRAHGRQMSYTPRASACQACGLCVVSCPEDAIRLEPRPDAPSRAE